MKKKSKDGIKFTLSSYTQESCTAGQLLQP